MKKNKAIILISIILFINMAAICLLGVKVYQLNGQMKNVIIDFYSSKS